MVQRTSQRQQHLCVVEGGEGRRGGREEGKRGGEGGRGRERRRERGWGRGGTKSTELLHESVQFTKIRHVHVF